MSAAVHVTPQDDLVAHDTISDGECVCGPTEQAHKTNDGRVVFWYVHHSLDGRESTEADALRDVLDGKPDDGPERRQG